MASVWESIRSFLRREAADIKDGVDSLREKLDAELTRRERELEATPSERIEMLQSEIDKTDDVFDRLDAEIDARMRASDEGADPADAAPDGSDDDPASDETA